LIHHNETVDALLNMDDFGGIEIWQRGPVYIYDHERPVNCLVIVC